MFVADEKQIAAVRYYTIDTVLPSYTATFWNTQIYFGGKQGWKYIMGAG